MTTSATTLPGGGTAAPGGGAGPVQAARRQRQPVSAWLLAPALVLFGGFAIVPLIGAVALSLTSWNGLGTPSWLGLENWRFVLGDHVTWLTLGITVKVMLGTWAVQTPLSLLLGVYLAPRGRWRAWMGLVYFVALLMSSSAVALVFKNLLDPNFGLAGPSGPGFLRHAWLGDPNTVLLAVILIIAWHFVPLHTLLYQAGARQIPGSLYEAAQLDGAGTVRRFFSITLPQLRYTIVTSSTLMLVGSLTYFDLVFVLTAGGPGYATRLLPLHMYLTGFNATEMGRASAIATILAVFGLCLSLGLTRLSGFNKMQSQQEGL
ncbi:carbohydrate ABC transporter permease [Cellulomonas sp.]|uniref:carbohydrate ABC transporter permease n=1 Tax=Cellulomonas sp. TaxID=40001 RepID=UPI0025C55C50|nr:sugar ABC transporter permease [Cellulomonas sp.]